MKNLYHSLLLLIAGSVQKQLASQIRYLKIENQILRSKLPARVNVTEQERNRLVKFGSKLGRALGELGDGRASGYVASLGSRSSQEGQAKPAKVGRRKTQQEIRELTVKLARENDWGYTRILGEIRKLGIKAVSRNSITC